MMRVLCVMKREMRGDGDDGGDGYDGVMMSYAVMHIPRASSFGT